MSTWNPRILNEIIARLLDPVERKIIWLNGAAGMGKSTIAATAREKAENLVIIYEAKLGKLKLCT